MHRSKPANSTHCAAACWQEPEMPAALSCSRAACSSVLAAATMWPSAMRTIWATTFLLEKKALRW